MKFVVVDIAASCGGALSILREFYEYVKQYERRHQWIFLLGDSYVEETGNIQVMTFPEVKKSHWKRMQFDLFAGKKTIEALCPDAVFSLQNTIIRGLGVPQILYVHQPVPFQSVKNFSLFKRKERGMAVYQHLIGRVIKKSICQSAYTVVQTQWMRKAVQDATKISDDRITVIAPDVSEFVKEESTSKWDCTSFFYPTSNTIYKNIGCLDKALEKVRNKVSTPISAKVTIEPSSEYNCITPIGKISHDAVMREYQKSTLVFPSYIETFGLPLLEARRMETVILASDTPFSREILDGYENAYFFDPFKSEQLESLMEQTVTGKIVKKDVAQSKTAYREKSGWAQVVQIMECCK